MQWASLPVHLYPWPQHLLEAGATTVLIALTLAVEPVHTTGALTKAFRHIQIQEALLTSETMDSDQHQLGETHQAMELAATTVWVQHQHGETL